LLFGASSLLGQAKALDVLVGLGLDGGRVGWGLAHWLSLLLAPLGLQSPYWSLLILIPLFVFALIAALGGLHGFPARLRHLLSAPSRSASTSAGGASSSFVDPGPVVSEAPLGASSPLAPSATRRKPPPLPPQFRKSFRVQPEQPTSSESLPPRDERLPGLDLLVNEQFSRPDERSINQTAGLIEKSLAEFGVPARVVGFRVGPTVTQFAVEPGYLEKDKNGAEGDPNRQKVRVAQVSALGRDLALALAAERLRIEAPVPGRPYIGIEVPNARSTIVRLRPILESEPFYKIASPLAIALGRDVSGQPIVADLARMPHLLVAGTTGSGKSVCIAALTTCLVMNNTPEELRLVMIDPKMVELVRSNGLPHLYGKVETELDRILGVLRWTVMEMDRRYKVLEASHSRNIDSYNRKIRRRRGEQILPRIVVMLDELADLMMSAPDQTEHNLVRLAQMARAVGIHLVVATQRPGVEVVTGLIKANFPSRIAFSVASSVDSRVILDTGGAESLLGRGDMLYQPPEASSPVRLQGVMVSDQEVERVITYWQKTWTQPPEVAPQPSPWEQMIAQEQELADRDLLVERAIEIVRQTQRASASLLQRRLHIGYPRAARLIDELEDMGIIGPAMGGGREREVLLDREDDEIDEH
jgi:S-DNA-T family DNA segregation ATPase FtsK/SpoIIIE